MSDHAPSVNITLELCDAFLAANDALMQRRACARRGESAVFAVLASQSDIDAHATRSAGCIRRQPICPRLLMPNWATTRFGISTMLAAGIPWPAMVLIEAR